MFAEGLLLGRKKFRAAHAHDAHAQHHHILLFGAGAREHPLQRQRMFQIAHGHHDAAGANIHRFAIDGVLVLQLEVILHLPGGQRMSAQVHPLADGEDEKEDRSKNQSADRGHRLGEEIHRRRTQQHQEN